MGFWVSLEGHDWALAAVLQAPRHPQEALSFLLSKVGRLPTLHGFSNSLIAEGRPTYAVPFYSCFRIASLNFSFEKPGVGCKMELLAI